MCTLRNVLMDQHFRLNYICWIVWGWFFKIRIISISRMHAAGDFILVYHIWFIMYDIVLWVRVGFLHKMTGIYVDFEAIGKYAGSHVPNKKSTIYMHRGIIITKSTHFDYHLRISDVRCWLKDWYWVHYWPWAIDACRDPWRWKRPWWIGEEGKSCSSEDGKVNLTPRVLIWLIVSLCLW